MRRAGDRLHPRTTPPAPISCHHRTRTPLGGRRVRGHAQSHLERSNSLASGLDERLAAPGAGRGIFATLATFAGGIGRPSAHPTFTFSLRSRPQAENRGLPAQRSPHSEIYSQHLSALAYSLLPKHLLTSQPSRTAPFSPRPPRSACYPEIEKRISAPRSSHRLGAVLLSTPIWGCRRIAKNR